MSFFENPVILALLGGILIGIAWLAMAFLTGRIMAASGMLGSLLGGAEGVAAPNIAFIGGIITASLVTSRLEFVQHTAIEAHWPFLVAGGLLVGASARLYGTSLGVVLTGTVRRAPRSLLMLLAVLAGAVIGAMLPVALIGVGEA